MVPSKSLSDHLLNIFHVQKHVWQLIGCYWDMTKVKVEILLVVTPFTFNEWPDQFNKVAFTVTYDDFLWTKN